MRLGRLFQLWLQLSLDVLACGFLHNLLDVVDVHGLVLHVVDAELPVGVLQNTAGIKGFRV